MTSTDAWRRTLHAAWQASFGRTVPLGHVLRADHPERWVRVHSFPDLQRVPSGPDDTAAFVARWNAVLTAVLGDTRGALVVDAEPGDRTDLPGPIADQLVLAWEVPENARHPAVALYAAPSRFRGVALAAAVRPVTVRSRRGR